MGSQPFLLEYKIFWWSHLWDTTVANDFHQMPVGISPQKYALDRNRQLSKYFTNGSSGERCQLWLMPLDLITICVLFRGCDYGWNNCLLGFMGVWQEGMEPERWCGGKGGRLLHFLSAFCVNMSWLIHAWSKQSSLRSFTASFLVTEYIQVGQMW